MVAANGTIVDHDIPSPKSDGIPFLHFESLLAITCSLSHARLRAFDELLALNRCGASIGIGHLDVGHIE